MQGRTVCVYGNVSAYTENWENKLTNFRFGTQEQFFLVSNSRWFNGDEYEGTCVSATGEIQLNTYDVPYIKIKKINSCP